LTISAIAHRVMQIDQWAARDQARRRYRKPMPRHTASTSGCIDDRRNGDTLLTLISQSTPDDYLRARALIEVQQPYPSRSNPTLFRGSPYLQPRGHRASQSPSPSRLESMIKVLLNTS